MINPKKNFNLSIILSVYKAINIPFLKRMEIDRLDDYKKAFIKWCKNDLVDKIIFIENSGYDLNFFNEESKNFPSKKIEIISSNLNNTFKKSLGKGYGEYLCLKEVFENSQTVNNTDYYLKVTGRYYIKNFNKIFDDLEKEIRHLCLY